MAAEARVEGWVGGREEVGRRAVMVVVRDVAVEVVTEGARVRRAVGAGVVVKTETAEGVEMMETVETVELVEMARAGAEVVKNGSHHGSHSLDSLFRMNKENTLHRALHRRNPSPSSTSMCSSNIRGNRLNHGCWPSGSAVRGIGWFGIVCQS